MAVITDFVSGNGKESVLSTDYKGKERSVITGFVWGFRSDNYDHHLNTRGGQGSPTDL